MVTNKFTGSTKMDGSEDSLFKIFGSTLKHFVSKIYMKALQAGDELVIRTYTKVDDISRWKFDGDVTDSVGSNNGTVTNISSFISQWKFDGNVLDSVGSNNGTITYHTSLKALYKFESNVNDSTTNANNGTVAGTTTYVTGQEGSAFSFDGTTRISVANNASLNGTGGVSISGWFFSAGDVALEQDLVRKDSQYMVRIDSTAEASNRLSFFVWTTGGTIHDRLSWVFTPNQWHHFSAVYDGTSGDWRLYGDGVLQSSATVAGTKTLNTSTNSMFIGDNGSGTAYVRSGTKLDEIRVYSIELTQAQISALYMNGKFAQSHTFDGGEYITIGSTGIPTGTSDRTISLWVMTPSTFVGGSMLIWWGAETTNNGFGLAWTSTASTSTITAVGWSNDKSSVTVFQPNLWYHVVLTLSSSGTVRNMYINGVLDGNFPYTTTALNTTAANYLIGNRTDLGAPLTGQLDEVRVYNTALTASQVLGLYNYTGSNYVTPLAQGNALSLDGSSYVTVTNQTPYNFERTNTFSASFWYKGSASDGTFLISKDDSGGVNRGYDIAVNGGGKVQIELISTYPTNALQVRGTTVITDGKFHNVVVTYDGTSTPAGVKLYIDGVSDSLSTLNNTLSATIQNSINLQFSGRNGANSLATGLIDEVQIWNYVVSSAEINAINAGRFANTHPIGLWHFDGDLYDYSGQGSTGNPTGTMTYVTGALSGSYNVPNTHFNFDGSEYIRVSSPSNLPLNNTDRTISFWLKTPTTFVTQTYIWAYGTLTAKNLCSCYYTSTGSTSQIASGNFSNDLLSTTVLQPDTWYHIVFTIETGGSVQKIYINGILDSSQSSVVTLNTLSSDLIIGARIDTAGITIQHLDDFRIYTRALSSAEVSDLYTYPDSGMKELLYQKTYAGVQTQECFIPYVTENQYMVTAQQTKGTNRIISWEREEVLA